MLIYSCSSPAIAVNWFRAVCKIAHTVVGRRLHAIDNRSNEFTRGEVLPSTLGRFGGALCQQPFVNVALHVGLRRRPLLGVDQVHD